MSASKNLLVVMVFSTLSTLGLGIYVGTKLNRGAAETAPKDSKDPLGALGAKTEGPEERSRIVLPKNATKNNAIETVSVKKARLARDLEVVGSVAYDADHFAEIGPLIPGRIVSLRAGIGDKVKAGQVLAEIESAEVGQAQAAYLSARATSAAAEANLRREKELAERKVSSEREREVAEAQAQTEKAHLEAATQRLRALGLRLEDINALLHDANYRKAGRVPLYSPIEGVVITRLVSLGQAVQPAADAFTVANLSKLWVLLELFEKDLAHVHVDQQAELRTEGYPGRKFPGRVSYVGHVIDEKTRTAPVRIEFDNKDGLFRPGLFVTATLHGDGERAGVEVLSVPRRAVLSVEGQQLAFVMEQDGSFSRRKVEIGASGGGLLEVRNGLGEGETVAADGAFLLKSELLR